MDFTSLGSMSIIDNSDYKESSVVIHFDRDWKVIHLIDQFPDNDYTPISYNDDHWQTIQLPHQSSIDESSTYWYRKRFDWRHQPDTQQHIYLNFTFTENDEDQQSKHKGLPGFNLWLNGVSIYAGSLPKVPIEITPYLSTSTENALVICSTEGCPLSLYARIIMPRVCTGKIDYEAVDKKTSKQHHDTLDYTASYNDMDGLIDVSLGLVQRKIKEQIQAYEYPEWDHVMNTVIC